MAFSLYDLSVPTFLQTVRAVGGCLHRTAEHCVHTGARADDLVDARLYPDMAPLHFQIEALTHHAVWGVHAVLTGAFTPPPLVGAMPFAELQRMIARAVTALEAFAPGEVNSCAGRPMDIVLYRPASEETARTLHWAPQTLAFTTETFLLSYTLPNVHFHAAMAYANLRARGAPIGKCDYEGRLRTRQP